MKIEMQVTSGAGFKPNCDRFVCSAPDSQRPILSGEMIFPEDFSEERRQEIYKAIKLQYHAYASSR